MRNSIVSSDQISEIKINFPAPGPKMHGQLSTPAILPQPISVGRLATSGQTQFLGMLAAAGICLLYCRFSLPLRLQAWYKQITSFFVSRSSLQDCC